MNEDKPMTETRKRARTESSSKTENSAETRENKCVFKTVLMISSTGHGFPRQEFSASIKGALWNIVICSVSTESASSIPSFQAGFGQPVGNYGPGSGGKFSRSSSGDVDIATFLDFKATTSNRSGSPMIDPSSGPANQSDNYCKIDILDSSFSQAIFSFVGRWASQDKVEYRSFCNIRELRRQHSFSARGMQMELSIGSFKSREREPSECLSTIESLKKMLDNDVLTDFVIKTSDDERIFAHKVVLAASSEPFKAMLENEMKEKSDNAASLNRYDSATIRDMLHYIYCKESPPNIDDTCFTLLDAANCYRLPGLVEICKRKMIRVIDVENAVEILQLAEKHDIKELKKYSVEFVVAHYKEVTTSAAWKNIPDEMLRDLMLTIVEAIGEKKQGR